MNRRHHTLSPVQNCIPQTIPAAFSAGLFSYSRPFELWKSRMAVYASLSRMASGVYIHSVLRIRSCVYHKAHTDSFYKKNAREVRAAAGSRVWHSSLFRSRE